jgi:hypothetical protein
MLHCPEKEVRQPCRLSPATAILSLIDLNSEIFSYTSLRKGVVAIFSPLIYSTDHLTIVSRMSNATESSLPTKAVITFCSSPPFITCFSERSLEEMTQGSVLKDKSPATQNPNSEASHAAHRRTSSSGTERPTSAQLSHDSTSEQKDRMVAGEQDDEDSDPADKIADFDWDDLLKRYHDAINQCSAEEAQLMEEWTSLMNVRRSPAF